MVVDLLLIGAAITLGPFHNTVFILLLSGERGVRKGLVFTLGWLANLVVVIGVVLLLTGGKPPAPHTAPSTAALAVKLTLGAVLVVFGERKRRRPVDRSGKQRRPPKWLARLDNASYWAAAGAAFLTQPWAMVGAGAATAVQSDPSSPGSALALIGFCVLASASLLIMELYAVFSPGPARAALNRLRGRLESQQDQVVVTLSLLLGLYLMAKSIYQLVT
ncbi:GAP family protein [Streptomyces sp. NPDC051976]|uniref:GAP family protein n=1 Tax=Streptomyces sp. NPDC051976 TaxID=3154947 RepID=UPI0034481E46